MVGFFFMAILQVARGQGFAPSPAPTNLPANDGMSIFMHNFAICGSPLPFFLPFWGGVVLGYCLMSGIQEEIKKNVSKRNSNTIPISRITHTN